MFIAILILCAIVGLLGILATETAPPLVDSDKAYGCGYFFMWGTIIGACSVGGVIAIITIGGGG
ncbi:MAG: hypothetical protein A2W25_12190 [candidate division Zixibacteria bacterium RBG_16_53_22]|nr:MAG: hypothetical protein A2W25_12190 [candidate division Zixibacteria bacterium RBG_16_53_22]